MPFGRKIEVKKSKYEIDMCSGSIMDKLISFSLPLMLSGILQLMFNAVDIIVVGRFSGSEALAAVGSTTALISMFTNLFIGVSLGTSVLTARFYAAGRDQEVSETVHTSIMLALLSGILMVFVGLFFSRGALELMDTPDDVIDLSTLYMKIYFVGMPFFMLYNYGAAVLRAVGDTKRPLFFLIISGVLNAGLNLFLVVVFHMGVAGVGALLAIPSIANRITYLFTADYLAASRRAGRVIRWSKGLKLLQESNPVLGFGLGRFGGAVAMPNKVIEETKDFSYFYMDNYYLKTLVEMGYLGLAFFILLLFGLVLWSLRSIGRTGYTKGDRTRVLAVSMFAGMCGVLVHCYFENIFEVPYMMAYFWSMAAAVMYLGYFRKRKT